MRRRILDNQLRRTKGELEREISGLVGAERFEAWKQFAFKGHMIQMAIAFMLGAAFQKVVGGLSDHIIMPLLNYVLQFTGTDWREQTYEVTEGLVLETGKFAGFLVDFLIISIILFYLFRKAESILNPKKKAEWKITCIDTIECPYCREHIYFAAKRCPVCTSWLKDNVWNTKNG